MSYPDILHQGAIQGVIGSCHQLLMDGFHSLRIDCGLFLGAETAAEGWSSAANPSIDFPLDSIKALVAIHVYTDPLGCIPYLLVVYHGQDTSSRAIQACGLRGSYMELDEQRYDIFAQIHTIGCYSAHADQKDLLGFVTRIAPLAQPGAHRPR